MVWVAFSPQGKTPIVTISTRMNSEEYIELLEDVLVPFTENIMSEELVFQQDTRQQENIDLVFGAGNQFFGLAFTQPGPKPDRKPLGYFCTAF